MHRVRYRAHRATAQAGSDSVNYNPFARIRSRESADVENQLHRTQSEQHPPAGDSKPPADQGLAAAPQAEEEKPTTDSTATGIAGRTTDENTTPAALQEEELTLEDRKKLALKRSIAPGVQIIRILGCNWFNLLLPFIPAGFVVFYTRLSPRIIFCINFVAIVPSSAILGYATQEAAVRVGDRLGALINMTFGNAVQLITSILLLKSRQIQVLQYSLLGNILSNLLLTTGLSFLLGGVNRIEQYFNASLAQTISMLLLLAVVSLVIPTASHLMTNTSPEGILAQSRGTSVVIIVSYILWMHFQLRTNKAMFEAPSKRGLARKSSKIGEGAASKAIATIGAGTSAATGGRVHSSTLVKWNEEEEEDEGLDFPDPELGPLSALLTLVIFVVLIAFNTQFATDSIQSLLQQQGLSQTFLGLIILPILSNDPISIDNAIKDKMNISITLTLERCMQASLLIIPLVVLLAWCMGIDDMTLQFDGFSVAALFASIIIVTYVVQEGKSNWLTGALLIKVFIIIALAAFYVH